MPMDGAFCLRCRPFSPLTTWAWKASACVVCRRLCQRPSRERKRTFLISEDVAIRISCAVHGASDWLNDVQSALRISDQEVQVAVGLRLGMPCRNYCHPLAPALCAGQTCAITRMANVGAALVVGFKLSRYLFSLVVGPLATR